jgi:hypothetical protein
MRYGRNWAVKLIVNKKSGEKSDIHLPDYILYRKVKFDPFSRDEFGFFDFLVATAIVGSEQGGTPPGLIVQNDIGNKYSPTLMRTWQTYIAKYP